MLAFLSAYHACFSCSERLNLLNAKDSASTRIHRRTLKMNYSCREYTSGHLPPSFIQSGGGDHIEVSKILNGMTRIDPANFWEVREARKRKRPVKELATYDLSNAVSPLTVNFAAY